MVEQNYSVVTRLDCTIWGVLCFFRVWFILRNLSKKFEKVIIFFILYLIWHKHFPGWFLFVMSYMVDLIPLMMLIIAWTSSLLESLRITKMSSVDLFLGYWCLHRCSIYLIVSIASESKTRVCAQTRRFLHAQNSRVRSVFVQPTSWLSWFKIPQAFLYRLVKLHH